MKGEEYVALTFRDHLMLFNVLKPCLQNFQACGSSTSIEVYGSDKLEHHKNASTLTTMELDGNNLL